jgi:hypothetical protein
MMTHKFKGSLTPETLADEYQTWLKVNGHGRNKFDQRFGQHIWNTYGNHEANVSFPQLFYTENSATAYKIAVNEIFYG